MQWDLLINPIFGGIIGYGTNYLAIKMLFRPYKTMYIGKMKIPFTPGLIPKEKATLAHQMGKITEDYLLTEDTLVETLTNHKAKEMFLAFIRDIPKEVQETIIEELSLEIITILGSKKLMDLAVPYIIDELSSLASGYADQALKGDTITEPIKIFTQATLEGDLAREHIYKLIEELEQKIYTALQDNAKQIGQAVIGAVGSGDEANKIKETLQHWVDENFNAMVSMFINIDKIYEGIIKFAGEALEDEERNSKFGHFLCTVAKGLIESEPDYQNKVINIIKDQISTDNIGIIIKIISRQVSQNEPAIKAQISCLIYSKWEAYVSAQGFQNKVKQALRQIGAIIGPDARIGEKIFFYYARIIENNSKNVAQMMDISSLVEDKINEFSTQESEKIILSVVKKQLRGITWIGALLGTIIGIFTNFIG